MGGAGREFTSLAVHGFICVFTAVALPCAKGLHIHPEFFVPTVIEHTKKVLSTIKLTQESEADAPSAW